MSASRLVSVEGRQPSTGNLLIVTVGIHKGNIVDFLRSLFDHRVELRLMTDDFLQGFSWERYQGQIDRLMEESKVAAAAVAQRHAGMRVEINSDDEQPRLARKVRFDDMEVGGSSAGLMLALEVYDQLTSEPLTNRLVAGTGSLRLNGTVEPVDGVAQKVVASQRRGAEWFLVPRENFRAAQKVASDIQLIPIDTFQQAVEILRADFGTR